MVCGLLKAGPVHLLAAGAYGYGNFGDDCYVDILRSRLAGNELEILHECDEAELRLHSYDASLLAGGGVLYESISSCGSHSLKHFLRYPAIAQWLGKKSFLLGVGAQGMILPQALTPFLNVLEGMNLRTVRDKFTASLLREAGVRAPVMECADLFYAKSVFPKQKGRRTPGKPVLGVVASQPGAGLLHPRFERFEVSLRDALRSLEKDFRLHFFSFDERSDPWLAQSWSGDHWYTRYDPSQPDAINELIRAFETVDVFLTTRFHGAILSTLAATPFVAIGAPHEKVQRECEAIRYPQFLSYASTSEHIAACVRETWAERREFGELLRRAAPQRKKLAQRNFDLLALEHSHPERNGMRMIPALVEAVRKAPRTLVLWAAGSECWTEALTVLERFREFDCVLPPKSTLYHAAITNRMLLPEPGIFNWLALPDVLKYRLVGRYDNVVICHAGASRKVDDLLEIAGEAGSCIWEFDVWTHSIQRREVMQLQEVSA